MELVAQSEYMTVERLITTNSMFATDQVYQNIERLVKALWRLGVSHNDISPRNVLVKYVQPDVGDVKLIDFGLSDMFSASVQSVQEYEQVYEGHSRHEQRGSNVEKLRELYNIIEHSSQ
jgi:tRNA A-37 threonylcarbamoyl transferase component Bud32